MSQLVYRRGFAALLAGLLAFGVISVAEKGCSADNETEQAHAKEPVEPRKILALTSEFSPGSFLSQDLYITNTSGEDLTEVNLNIELVGEDHRPSVTRYWANWPLGVRQVVSVPADEVRNVQRVIIIGSASEGRIELVLARND